jgi:hypothetical protein
MSKEIDALLEERAAYVKRNLPKRVESVDAALRELGFDHKHSSKEPQIETASIEVEVEKSVLKRGKKKKA